MRITRRLAEKTLNPHAKETNWNGHLMTYTKNQVKNLSETFEVKCQHFYKKLLRENFTTVDSAFIGKTPNAKAERKNI